MPRTLSLVTLRYVAEALDNCRKWRQGTMTLGQYRAYVDALPTTVDTLDDTGINPFPGELKPSVTLPEATSTSLQNLFASLRSFRAGTTTAAQLRAIIDALPSDVIDVIGLVRGRV